jgi:hypothetical protein
MANGQALARLTSIHRLNLMTYGPKCRCDASPGAAPRTS